MRVSNLHQGPYHASAGWVELTHSLPVYVSFYLPRDLDLLYM
jgi:hypothetical protein